MIRPALALFAVVAIAATTGACKKHVTPDQCDQLLDRYAQFVVTEKAKDATPEAIKAEQAREREEARSDDDFKNCTSELSTEDFACAMAAQTSAALLKCLE
jgi:hypothetical protein